MFLSKNENEIMNNDEKFQQKKVAIYLRVSTEDQKERYGIQLQKEAITNLLKSKKHPDGTDKYIIDEKYIFVDDISGTTPIMERPSFRKLVEELDLNPHKPFDVVAVYKIDRFARKLKILLNIIDLLDERKVEFLSANESIDTSTPFGKAMLGIIGVIAELEIETTKLRTRDGRIEAIKNGSFMGSNAPFGYNTDPMNRLIPFEEEKKVVQLIYDMFTRQNYTAQQIADYLTKNKYLSPEASAVKRGKKAGKIKKRNKAHFWRAEKVVKILSDEVYIGNYYYNKYVKNKRVSKDQWKISPYHHEPLIDDSLFKLTSFTLKQKGKYTKKREYKKHVYLLSGLVKCSSCRESTLLTELSTWVGTRKKVRSTGRYSYYYVCGNRNSKKTSYPCHVLPLPAEPIENYVIEYVKKLLKNPVAVFEYQKELRSNQLELKRLRERRDQVRKLLNSIPSMMERIKEQHELGVTSTDEMIEKVTEYREDQKRLEDEQNYIDMQIGQKANLEDYEKSLKLFSKKYIDTLEKAQDDREKTFEILHLLIEGIVVYSRRPHIGEKIAGRKKAKRSTKDGEKVAYEKGKLVMRTVQETKALYEQEGPNSDQLVPSEIDIYLKLPQQILINMAKSHVLHENEEEQFGVNSDDL